MLGALVAVALTGCGGGGDRALSVQELKAGLRAAGVERVYVFSGRNRPDYVQVSNYPRFLLVRFGAVLPAMHVAAHTRPTYRVGQDVQRMERACNVLIYNFAGGRRAAVVAAAHIADTLRERCR